MGRILASVIILIALALPLSVSAQQDITPRLDIVFVDTDRGSFTDEDIQEYLTTVDDALAFWDISPALSVSRQYVARAYMNLDYIDLYKDIPTLYVVYTNGTALVHGSHGTASYTFMFAVTSNSAPWPAATLSHEFGHLFFGLPDLYHQGDCVITDIMCNHVQAYKIDFIGCQSLALLHMPCNKVALPLVQ
jgi:hypothetical protein